MNMTAKGASRSGSRMTMDRRASPFIYSL
uniref:Uncharacterized protein n=1 Tax=Anguilla anguilla TaxID=7936 RepID=A0A0E9PCG1_ANGAN